MIQFTGLRYNTMVCSALAVALSLLFYAYLIMFVLYMFDKLPPEYYNSLIYYVPGSFFILTLVDASVCEYSIFVTPEYLFNVFNGLQEFVDSFHTDSRHLLRDKNGGRRLRRK